jgi:hypothetical protein
MNRALSKDTIQMAKKHKKKSLTSLAIKELQIKTTLRFHLTSYHQEHKQQQILARMCEKGNLIHCL